MQISNMDAVTKRRLFSVLYRIIDLYKMCIFFNCLVNLGREEKQIENPFGHYCKQKVFKKSRILTLHPKQCFNNDNGCEFQQVLRQMLLLELDSIFCAHMLNHF